MENESRLRILFVTRTNRHNAEELDIYVRVTCFGKRSVFSLNRRITKHLWDARHKRGKGSSQYVIALNKYLNNVHAKLFDCHNQLLFEEKDITATAITHRYFGRDEKSRTLIQLVDYHNKTMEPVLRPGTIKNYRSSKKVLIRFLKDEYGMEDYSLKKLSYRFITDFEYYLRNYKPHTRQACSNNGVMKHMERLKKLSRLAVKLEWINKDPFVNYKLRFQKIEKGFLSERELYLLEETIFHDNRLQRTKDVFLFSCYTGLAYIDVKTLMEENVLKGIDGNDWIYATRTKTNGSLKIPLLPKAKEILDRYRGKEFVGYEGKMFPVYSNQKINQYLKEIAEVCKINKRVTFHMARHTFATTVTLSNGVPIETVSKLLGHTKLSTTQIYAKVIETKVGEDMRDLVEKMKRKEVRPQHSGNSY